MKPIPFKEQTTVTAKDQPEYQPLPVRIDPSIKGETVSCWSLSLKERIILLFTGKLWMQLLTFRQDDGKLNPITPSYLTVNKSEVIPDNQ